MDKFKSSLRTFVDTERSSLPEDFDRGYVDAFLRAQARAEGEFFTDEQLIISVEDFFTGGSGTVSKTLAYAILFMIKNPKIQEKAASEIRDLLGNGGT